MIKKNIVIIAAVLFCTIGSAQKEEGFSFQGYARNAIGSPLKNVENMEVKFSLFTSDENTPEFLETQFLSTNEFGVFSCLIGAVNVLGFSSLDFLNFDYILKVEVQVDGGWQTITRKTLFAVPYAKAAQKSKLSIYADTAQFAQNASYAENTTNAVNGVPVGTIISFAGDQTTVPDGWLLCNGQALNGNDANYQDLYGVIKTNWGGTGKSNFNVPNLSGVFLRGVDHNQNYDMDRSTRFSPISGGNTGNKVGSYQLSEYKSHNHTSGYGGNHNHSGGGGAYLWYRDVDYNGRGQSPTGLDDGKGDYEEIDLLGYKSIGYDGSHSHVINANGGSETRPTNAYVNYIIKY